MYRISTHIINEMKDSNVVLEILEEEKNEILLKNVMNKYIDKNKSNCYLWERFIDFNYIQDDMSWHYIKDYIGNKECILFFDQEQEKEMFKLRSGNDLDYLLSETYGFEFYVTDEYASYIICLNHHNILYGCGDAKMWIKNMI